MAKKKNLRFVNKMRNFWPFRRHRPLECFEHSHLPDEGQGFLKPTLAILQDELGILPITDREKAKNLFEWAEEQFKNHRYREAVACFQEAGSDSESLSVLLLKGTALTMLSEFQQASGTFERGLNLSKQRQAERFEAAFGINLGQIYHLLGKPDLSREILQRSRQICKASGNAMLEALALRHLGIIFSARALYDQALKCCNEAMSISELAGDDLGIAHALCNKGLILIPKRNLAKAEGNFQKGLALGQKVRDPFVLGRIYTNLSSLYLTQEKVQESISVLRKALDIHHNVGYSQGKARNLGMLAIIQTAQGNIDDGQKTFQQAIEMGYQSGYRLGIVRDHFTFARIQLSSGQLDSARQLFQNAFDMAGEIGHRYSQEESRVMLLQLTPDIETHRKITILHEALTQSQKLCNPVLQIHILNQFCIHYATTKEFSEATHYCQQSIALSKKISNLYEEAQALMLMAYIHRQQGQTELAEQNTSIAHALLSSKNAN